MEDKGQKETGRLMFIDLETTGLPVSWQIPPERFEFWPYIVEVAYIITDYDGNELEIYRQISKPEGWTIPTASIRLHKITNKIAEQEGINILYILETLELAISEVDIIIAHNIEFDINVLKAEFHRYDMDISEIIKTPTFCTMKRFTEYCKIPSKKGYEYKYPKLTELNEAIFGQSIPNAHSALSDVYATMFCFFELKKRKLFVLESPEEKRERRALEGNKEEELKQKQKFQKNREDYKNTEAYKTDYKKLYEDISLCFSNSDDTELLQKRNTMRSNIVNRRNTIKKIETQIKEEENTEKQEHLERKLNKKYTELNRYVTEVEIIDDLLYKKEKTQYIKEEYPKIQELQEKQKLRREQKAEKEQMGCIWAVIVVAIISIVIFLIV